MFKGKTVAVTGGLGSIGSHIIKKVLLHHPKKIVLLDNRETELFYAIEYPDDDRVQSFFCDIREKEEVMKCLKNVDIVFNAGAMKHVVVCERNPFESVKTNVIGTQNVIDACLENHVEKMILISTDKAVNPTNVMGATKLLAERLVSAMCNIRCDDETKFGIVRFGNVLYSRGSVLEIWKRQLEQGKKISITDPEMTRFFMDVDQSVDLIFAASQYAENGETFILKMPSVKIGMLSEVFLEIMDFPDHYSRIIGIRPGEKMHEDLILHNEGFLLENDLFFLKVPLKMGQKNINKYKSFCQSIKTSFISNDPEYLMDKKSVINVLKNRFLL